MSTSSKRRINLTVSEEVVSAANEAGLNLSRIAEDALRDAVSHARRMAWERDHAADIASYNERVTKEGLWSDGRRLF